jgi:hypothetical protein
VSDSETGRNLDNSTRQPLTGWKLWWTLFLRAGSGRIEGYYKDSTFAACPACGSPNVMVLAHRKGHLYQCLELNCRSHGACEVEGSNGVEERKAKVRTYVVTVAFLVLLTVLWLTGHLPSSRREIDVCGWIAVSVSRPW